MYKQEKSYPSVYRELIRDIEPDDAISIIHELQQITVRLTEEKLEVN
jgi:hypothetical protein